VGRVDPRELIRLAERELAEGRQPAPKTLERARRGLLKRRDGNGLRELLELAGRIHDGGDLAYAIRQNLRFLERRAQPQPPPASPQAALEPRRSFLFGDPRRPRSLALALIAALATFPLCWGLLLIVWGLGGGNTPTSDEATRHAERVIVVLAGIFPALGIVAACLDWRGARHSYPPGARGALLNREGVLCAGAVLTVMAGAVALGLLLWNSFV
jgi:hypothetical protein